LDKEREKETPVMQWLIIMDSHSALLIKTIKVLTALKDVKVVGGIMTATMPISMANTAQVL